MRDAIHLYKEVIEIREYQVYGQLVRVSDSKVYGLFMEFNSNINYYSAYIATPLHTLEMLFIY